MAGAVDRDKQPQDARFPQDLALAYSVRSTYRPREEGRDFGSIAVRRKLFTPTINGFGPRTISRGPNPPPGDSVPPGALRPMGKKTR